MPLDFGDFNYMLLTYTTCISKHAVSRQYLTVKLIKASAAEKDTLRSKTHFLY